MKPFTTSPSALAHVHNLVKRKQQTVIVLLSVATGMLMHCCGMQSTSVPGESVSMETGMLLYCCGMQSTSDPGEASSTPSGGTGRNYLANYITYIGRGTCALIQT